MSRRDAYEPGVPCFVDTLTTDVEAAKRFYRGIFGWEYAGPGPMPGDPPGEYFVAQLRGLDVAGIGSPPPGGATHAGSQTPAGEPTPAGAPAPAQALAAWNTHVSVASADEAAVTAADAGGTVLVEPFDAPPAGRMAVLADPAGAAFCVWEPATRQGAALVNEASAWAMSMLATDDPESAQTFYGRLFGWRAESFDAGPGVEVWLWRLPGFVGGEPQQPVPRDVVATMMRQEGGHDGPPPNWSVDFWIADADAAAAAAPGLGGAVVVAPHEMAGFRRTILADPRGAVFSASQLLVAH